MSVSPLINNSNLSLDANGDLVVDLDIRTQMEVGLTGYNCMYNANLNSTLLQYLNFPVGGINRNTIVNKIKSAYTFMINQRIISGLQVSVPVITVSTVAININAKDAQGNSVSLNWIN